MLAIGIDIGGMSMKLGLVNEKGEVKDTFTVVTKSGDPYEVTIKNLVHGIKELISRNKLYPDDINGIGIGVPGAINANTGIVDSAVNLGWYNVPLRDMIQEATGIQVRLTNDANAAALGEAKFGCKGKYQNVVMLTLGTGVGGGVIIDGKLFEGNQGKGTELGHSTLIMDGEPCNCGRRGCIEAYASATALMRQTREEMNKNKDSLMWKLCEGDINNVNGKVPFDACKAGDPSGIKVIDNYVKYLGETILNYNNIFRPQAFVLSGGVAKQGDYLVSKLKEYCDKFYWGYKNTPVPDLVIASLGYESGIIGAASLYL